MHESACLSSQNVCPMKSLGAAGKTDCSFAFVRESPDANRVTSWLALTSPSASSDTIHSIPPYRRGGTGNQTGLSTAIRSRSFVRVMSPAR
jgi:hypothetical protein